MGLCPRNGDHGPLVLAGQERRGHLPPASDRTAPRRECRATGAWLHTQTLLETRPEGGTDEEIRGPGLPVVGAA